MAGERDAIIAYFRTIDSGDLIALPPNPERHDQSDGHDEARQVAQQRGIENPHWVFWHRQAAWVFDSNGDLTHGLNLNWGGDHDTVHAALSDLPVPFRVQSNGEGGVFVVTSDETPARAAEPLPDPTDTAAVKDRIRLITAAVDRREPEMWTDAERQWMQEVLIHGDISAQGAVVPWAVLWDGLSAEALDAVLARWTRIYAKAPSWAMTRTLLELLERRADPRLDQVVEECMKRKNAVFLGGVSHFLADRRSAENIPLLYQLAQNPARAAGKSQAMKAWVWARATAENRPAEEIAAEALDDPEFGDDVRRDLERIVRHGIR